jgi:hypothetical protein
MILSTSFGAVKPLKHISFLGLFLFSLFGNHLLGQIVMDPNDPEWMKKPKYVPAYNICFPADAVSNNCTKPPIKDIYLDEINEDILAVNVTDKVYNTDFDGCYKIFRTYTVINWKLYNEKCQLDPMSSPVVIDRYNYKTNLSGGGICVLVRGNTAYLSDDQTIDDEDKVLGLYPTCWANGGWHYRGFMYTQIIKVYDDVPPVIEKPASVVFPTDLLNCVATATLSFKATDNCNSKVTFEPTLAAIAPAQTLAQDQLRKPSNFDANWSWKDNEDGSFSLKIANLPEGKYDFLAVVRDGCGNLSAATRIPFEVKDLIAPAPTCINGLSVGLMSDGKGGATNTVWASEMIASPSYDCNGQGPERNAQGLLKITKYSINRVGEKASIDQTSLVLNCADAGKQLKVEVHTWDSRGNHDYCQTYLLPQDNSKNCPAAPAINGSVATTLGKAIPNVQILIVAADHEAASQTNQQGLYSAINLPGPKNYVVQPKLKQKDTDGIGIADLNVIFQMALTGAIPTNSNPYLLLAADIDGNGQVTIDDHALLRRIIFKQDTFPGGSAWRFIDASYKFTDPTKPWSNSLPQTIRLDSLRSARNASFIAYKLGDLDGSFEPNATYFNEVKRPKEIKVMVIGAPSLANDDSEVTAKTAVSIPVIPVIDARLSGELTLDPNRPNPFGNQTTVSFYLPQAGMVNLSVWDAQGRQVLSKSARLDGGAQQFLLTAEDFGNAQGLLYYSVQTLSERKVGKMVRVGNF